MQQIRVKFALCFSVSLLAAHKYARMQWSKNSTQQFGDKNSFFAYPLSLGVVVGLLSMFECGGGRIPETRIGKDILARFRWCYILVIEDLLYGFQVHLDSIIDEFQNE